MFFDRTRPEDPALTQYKLCHSKQQGRQTGTLRVNFAADTFVDGGRSLSWRVIERDDCDDFLKVPTKRHKFLTSVLGDSQYNQVIRTMNDHRIPLETPFLFDTTKTRKRLAPRNLA
ncbi:hypothetical protein PG985_005092 [Apiospora marii]|uniref:Uncharacterized protein n=1 Tax=Apiospora marii TaxID=335849 RepID=A0ABR1SB04_9PEZI